MDYAENGNLSMYDSEDIADAAGWDDGDAQLFVDAMLECGPGDKAGFLEMVDGNLIVHDWQNYIGRLIEKREQNRLRRAKSRTGTDVAQDDGGDTDNVTHESRVTNNTVTQESQGYQHNRTVPNTTEPNRTNTTSAKVPPAEKSPKKGDGARESGNGNEYAAEFEAFWREYPRKVEKSKAYRCWKAEIKGGAKSEDMILAARNYAQECRVKRTEERYVKHGSTFLGPDKPWREFLTDSGEVRSLHGVPDPDEIKRRFAAKYGCAQKGGDVIDVRAGLDPVLPAG